MTRLSGEYNAVIFNTKSIMNYTEQEFEHLINKYNNFNVHIKLIAAAYSAYSLNCCNGLSQQTLRSGNKSLDLAHYCLYGIQNQVFDFSW